MEANNSEATVNSLTCQRQISNKQQSELHNSAGALDFSAPALSGRGTFGGESSCQEQSFTHLRVNAQSKVCSAFSASSLASQDFISDSTSPTSSNYSVWRQPNKDSSQRVRVKD